MKNDKEKWIEGVFESLKGSQRAKPSRELFAKIEGQIYKSEAKVIPLHQLRMAAASVILLLILNVFAFSQYAQNSTISTEDSVVYDASNQALISNYQLYE